MKLSLSIVTLLLSSFVAAERLSFFNSKGQQPINKVGDPLAVPGENPLVHCTPEHADDILTLTKVDLTPNPPLAGTTLTIKAEGTLSQEITQGAYVKLQIKYGYIKILTTTADLCEQVKQVDLECPVEKGAIVFTKEVELPKEIPPGKYTVEADVFTEDDVRITCLKAAVAFTVGGR